MPDESGARIVIDLHAVVGIKVSWDDATEKWQSMNDHERTDARRSHRILMIGHRSGY